MKHSSCFNPNESRGRKIIRVVLWIIGGMAIAVVFALVFGFLVQYLWNWLLHGLFEFPVITYWQAFGILILAKILFGGLGHPGHKNHRDKESKPMFDSHCGHSHSTDFKQFWEDEGKKAFERYVENKKQGTE